MNGCDTLLLNGLKLFHLLFLASVISTSASAQHDFSRNSTAKIRVKPSPVAARVGSAVNWRKNLEEALSEAATTDKPVFWYVPTLRGTFMDRKDSVDRYMLAGPFSWPNTINLLNEHFIPVKMPPKMAQQTAYDIKPYVFVEPGFVILKSDGELLGKVDRLTTLHPRWLYHLISGFAGHVPDAPRSTPLEKLWKQFADRDYANMKFLDSDESPDRVEIMLLEGMTRFRLGDHAGAKQIWEQASLVDPESPLAWKAAAEAEGFGPFVRGFEVHGSLPTDILQSNAKTNGSAALPNIYSEAELWRRGVEFLLDMQSSNGGWFDSDYDFGGTDSLPNVHLAVSALAAMALLESKTSANFDDSFDARISLALEKATEFILDDKNLNPNDRDELAWAYIYRIRFLARLMTAKAVKRDQRDALVANVKALESMQTGTGSWFHEYPNPMISASALMAFAEAADVGVIPQKETISRGVPALSKDRFGNGGFTYSSSRGRNELGAGTDREIAQAAGRMPLCELALWFHDASNPQRLANAVERSFELAEPLMNSLKYDNHTSNYAYGGFFIWYDIEARGEAILRLDDADLKAKYQQIQRELILSLPEVDGCFVDSHELGRVYGTAMALLSLAKTHR